MTPRSHLWFGLASLDWGCGSGGWPLPTSGGRRKRGVRSPGRTPVRPVPVFCSRFRRHRKDRWFSELSCASRKKHKRLV